MGRKTDRRFVACRIVGLVAATALVCVVVLSSAGVATAQRTPAGGETEIGYSTQDGSFVMGPDGSNPRGLTTGLAPPAPNSAQPITGPIVVSPDGTSEAYWRDFNEPASRPDDARPVGVWVATSSGGQPHQVWAAPSKYVPVRTTVTPDEPIPRWNPSGTELAVIVSRTDYQFGVLLMRPNGTQAHYLQDPNGTSPPLAVEPLAWSPNGKELVYVDDLRSIVAVPIAGGPIRVISTLGDNANLPNSLSWSPDGSRILAAFAQGVRPGTTGTAGVAETYPASGGPGVVIYQESATVLASGMYGLGVIDAYYSPDGKQIVISTQDPNYQAEESTPAIQVLKADGTDAALLPGTEDLGALQESLSITGWFRVSSGNGPMAPSSGYWIAGSGGAVASYGGAYAGPKSPPEVKPPVTAITAGLSFLGGPLDGGYQLVTAGGELIDAGPATPPENFSGHIGPAVVSACQDAFIDTEGEIYNGSYTGRYSSIAINSESPSGMVPDQTGKIVGTICEPTTPLILSTNGVVYSSLPGSNRFAPIEVETIPGITAPIVGGAYDPVSGGYWLVGSDGNVYGVDASLHGNLKGKRLGAPVVGIAGDEATGGYWIATADGTIYGFDAPSERHSGGPRLTSNVVGIAASPFPSSKNNAF